MANIFTDGIIVHTLPIPTVFFQSPVPVSEKKHWGAQVLKDYVAQFHGAEEVRYNVSPSRSRNGKLTGTQVVIRSGSKRIVYMMVEPDENLGKNQVHIAKMEEDWDQDDPFAAIDWRYGEQGLKARASINNPFAALAGLKAKITKT